MRVRGRRQIVDTDLVLPAEVQATIGARNVRIAEDVVAAIIAEVPSYENALSERMGDVIRDAVRIALDTFLSLVSDPGRDAEEMMAPAVDGAYQLGRGEARSGRTIDALLAAYRIGARTWWRNVSGELVDHGSDSALMAAFAERTFAYIDELSAASAQGHADEAATAGRVRQRLLERIGLHLMEGAPEATVVRLAERADWALPTTLTALLVPDSEVRSALAALPPGTLQVSDLPELDTTTLLFAPDVHGRQRGVAVRVAQDRRGHAGPARPWAAARTSYLRAVRTLELGLGADSEEHLAQLVLTADPEALADLRARALAPLAGLRPATVAKLEETLRAWLLHQGRRDDVAAALFVHPQTVRYRVGQLREAFGDALDDPATVLDLTVALGVVTRDVPDAGRPATP